SALSGLADFVIGYSGNLGQVHDVETMLGAAEILADNPRIKFLFIGGGKLRETLNEAIEARGLSNIQTRPYQPRDQLRLSLTLADIHWASLMPVMEGLILPSKLYGIAAAGRPMIMVGDENGDIGRILTKWEFGVTVPIGNSEGFANAILELDRDAERYARYAANARRFIDDEAGRARIIENWAEMLDEVSA
ncbi:MAG: glycosyltransferase, partial [Pseudomonadota bacterium]